MIHRENVAGGRKVLSERMLLLLLAAVQFTAMMDFMMMMPLGPQLMRELVISPQAFGNLISAFSLTAGVVGLSFAPFMDRFDRRSLLLVSYAGFALGTLACGLSQTYGTLMLSRAVCGAFGGVAGASLMTIVADLIPKERRAHAMGIIMTAFSAAAALGVPFGLKIAQVWKWEAPFLAVSGLSGAVWLALWMVLPSVRGHLDKVGDTTQASRSKEFLKLLKNLNAWRGILLMSLVVLGHFTLIPYLAPFLVNNVGLPEDRLFLVYLLGGLATVITGPLIGKLADKTGKLRVYIGLVCVTAMVVTTLTYSRPDALWQILAITCAFFIFASSRFIPVQAVVSQAVEQRRRGAYMSLIACSRDFTAGISAVIGGLVIAESSDGKMLHYQWLGWLAIGVSLVSVFVFRKVREVGE